MNLTLDVTWSLACGAARMLAPDGRCKTLDAAADGYVRAEAGQIQHHIVFCKSHG